MSCPTEPTLFYLLTFYISFSLDKVNVGFNQRTEMIVESRVYFEEAPKDLAGEFLLFVHSDRYF